ncbi:MAG: MBL fold metallo-hydrolase [Oscillospiraceae bacterium]|nr:MBL fold metallo-hydrolase [Oscillospiraceae bacterium]
MRITWLGHACFALESGGYRIITDPWRDVPGFGTMNAEAHALYCSHGHYDHAASETVTLLAAPPSPFSVAEIPSFHDEVCGAKRGENTIRIFEAEALRIAHLGDLGHLLIEAQLEALHRVDVLLIPVGGIYTLDPREAKQTADAIGAKLIVPMHYRRGDLGFDNIADVEEFLSLFDDKCVVRIDSNAFCPTEYEQGTVLLPSYLKQQK